jgi:hypothetical protein
MALGQVILELGNLDPILLSCVAVTHSDRVIIERIKVHSDTIIYTNLISASVSSSDGRGLIIKAGKMEF